MPKIKKGAYQIRKSEWNKRKMETKIKNKNKDRYA